MILPLVLGVALLIINYTLAKRLFKPKSIYSDSLEIEEFLKEDFEIDHRLSRVKVVRIVVLFATIITLIPCFGLLVQLFLNLIIWVFGVFGEGYFIPRKPKNRIKFLIHYIVILHVINIHKNFIISEWG